MRFALGTLLLGLLAGCSSPRVGVDHDPEYDFAGLTTYAWTEGTPAENELDERRIVASVDERMAARGLRLVEEGPELLVRTRVSGRQEIRSSGGSVGVGYGTGWGRVGMSSGNRVYEVTIGTLVIEVLDGPEERVVWRAEAEGTVQNDNPQKTAEKIQAVIEKAFEGFPPG